MVVGTIARGLARGLRAGARGLDAARDLGPLKFGQLTGSLFRSPRAGLVAGEAARGAVKGGLLGGGLAIATGNADWIPLIAGMGAYRAGGKEMIATRAKGATGGFDTALRGMFSPGKMTRNFALGASVGVATGNPNWGVYGVVGAPIAGFLARDMFNPLHAGRAMAGMAMMPIAPRTAMRVFGKMSLTQAGGGAGFAGSMIGLGIAGHKLATGSTQDVTSGYYPGGIMPLHPGGRGIANNNLNTEGLTLALHKNSRRTRVM